MFDVRTHGGLISLIVLVLGVCSTVCTGTPRDRMQFTNARLDESYPFLFSSYASVNVGVTYSVQYLTLVGTIAFDAGSTTPYTPNLEVTVTAPSGEIFTIRPFLTNSPTQTISITPTLVYKLPRPVASVGTWSTRVTYACTVASGQWNTLTVGLNDGPPVVPTNFLAPPPAQPLAVIGNVLAPGLHLIAQPLPANGALWYRIDLPVPINTVNTGLSLFNALLDIDTEGSAVSASLGFFDADGNLLATDYFSGSLGGGGQAQLSFGTAPGRPAVGNAGSAYNNRNGVLAPGVYYIAIARFTAQYAPGWGVTSAAGGGSMTLNIRTNISSSPICPADFNRSGTLSVQDIFDFINGWLAGCG
jgi:hypothetical protein